MQNTNQSQPDLTDPEFEPTDAQLLFITAEMMRGVRERAEKAKLMMGALMSEAICETAGDSSASNRQEMVR